MSTEPSFYRAKSNAKQKAFYKNWYVKLVDPSLNQALWLKFSVLSSSNGFRRIAEVWAVFFQKSGRDIKKVALKQTYDIQEFLISEGSDIRIGQCELSPQQTRGSIHSKGNSIEWDLTFVSSQQGTAHFVPDIMSTTRIMRNSVVTLCEELLFSGTARVNGELFQWKEAIGMQGYLDGSKNHHSWTWGHCNTFVNEQGRLVPATFEGISTKAQVGPLIIPRLSSFYFYYHHEHYHLNTLRDAFNIKSRCTLNEWVFQADRDDLSFRGEARCTYQCFAGLTFEDTTGSILYCTHSEVADMKIHVYRKGKLEATLIAAGTAGLEMVSRVKNPYVPVLI
jgi:hypothetical protein